MANQLLLWGGFGAFVLGMLALDLGVADRLGDVFVRVLGLGGLLQDLERPPYDAKPAFEITLLKCGIPKSERVSANRWELGS